MAKFDDKVDLYDDRGNLVESQVPLEALSPLRNPAIKSIIQGIKRTVAVNLEGIENALKAAKVGGPACKILGREMDLDVVGSADSIAAAAKEMIQVTADDDTKVELLAGGKRALVQIPSERFEAAAEYSAAPLVTATAFVQAIINEFDVSMYDANMIKAAVLGRYPQSVEYMGANIATMLDIPQKLEGPGYSLRNVMVNHVVAATLKNTMQSAALSSILEQAAMFEMGDAVGAFERMHLLGLAYQGMNADNLVYDLVKANGAEGTVGSVIADLVERAAADGVIGVEKDLNGFNVYGTDDLAKWNAYAAAGQMAATMVNQGAARAAQGVSSTLLYYNDLIEFETGLPSVDFGRVEGVAVGFSFFSHSIYGGGGPGIFNGNHIVTRHSKGFAIPCVSAAMALDAGTQMFSPEATSGLIKEVFSQVDEFREPLKYVVEAAANIKGDI
ncbi:coenzyme-B sulfoethylthiotransferase subunit beta [Methanobacterium alkalithermotolerans]|uniref:Methyl-coenzyme M reductase subunit beta n=1 Tax=Methanobacterium alkalithermotolerans TaxID=2731220 RepID=A0A8T8K7T0_9EURY|nr:coenzyme-B sulfoethylthiotransferase subunit beta [Methanobacterium alkalithermotolerans]QUH23173.1 coenzyme-B sulfoethylthiotransferase subunit beta [Methanobacterium alkalithermotolerans]RJS49171.1 MAG: coenzyme-B sulfoethylthiotransferase subunit beta [Methanobacterium sp.]